MGLQRFPLKFGGVNFQDGPFELQPFEAQDALNCTLTERGNLSQRAGKVQFAGWTTPAGVADHMRPWYFGTTRVIVASILGDIHTISTGGAVTSRHGGTDGKIWHFEQAVDGTGADKLWCLNGTDTPQKLDTTFAPSDWANTPPNGTMLRVWKNRMCIAGVAAYPQRLFFSDIGNPEAPASSYGTNWVDIKATEDDIEDITWIEVIGDLLIVFKRRSLWVVLDPVTFTNRRIGNQGCEGRFHSCTSAGWVYFLNRTGVFRTNGQRTEYVSRKISPFFRNSIAMADIAKARLASTRDGRILVAVSTSGAVNNRLIEGLPFLSGEPEFGHADTPQGAGVPWMIHTFPVASLCTFRPISNDVLVGAASNAQEIHTLFSGSDDDGVAISSRWKSSWKSLIAEEPLERIRRVNLEFSGKLVVELFRDFSNSPKYSKALETQVDPDPLWDGGVWDGGTWDPEVGVELKRVRPESRGRYHCIQFRNDELGKTFSIYAAELVLRGGKEH